MTDNLDPPKAEAVAVDWPPTEYRVWVQSQIANRVQRSLLAVFGSISVVGLIGAAIAVWNLTQAVSENIKEDMNENISLIETNLTKSVEQSATVLKYELEAHIQRILPEQISAALARDEAIKAAVTAAFIAEIPTIMDGDDFKERLYAQIETVLAERGGVERIVISDVLARAMNAEAAPSSRALSLELYAVLSGSGGQNESRQDIRDKFNAVVLENMGERMAPQLLATILTHYPPYRDGERNPGNAGRRCIEDSECSVHTDRFVALQILKQLVANPNEYAELRRQYIDFFSGFSATVLDYVYPTIRNNASSAIARDVLFAYVRQPGPARPSTTVNYAVDLAVHPVPEARRLGLETLALLDPFAELWPDARRLALDDLLSSESFVGLLDARLSQDRMPDLPAPSTPDDVGWPEDAELAMRAALNLVRTQGADADADWHILMSERLPAATRLKLPLQLWMTRALADEAKFGRDPQAADRVLEDMMAGAGSEVGPLTHDRLREAVRMASPEVALRQVVDALQRLQSDEEQGKSPVQGSTPEAGDLPWRVVHAAVLRNVMEMSPGFAPIDAVLAQDSPYGEPIRDFVLASLAGSDFETARKADAEPMAAALSFFVTRAGEDAPYQRDLAGIVMDELLRRKRGDQCGLWASAEASGLGTALAGGRFDGLPAIDAIKEQTPWLGEPISADTPRFGLARDWTWSGEHPVAGGGWIAFDVQEPVELIVHVDPRIRLEVVAMTRDRTRQVDRKWVDSGMTTLHLPPETYAVSIRRCDGLDDPVELALETHESMGLPLSPNDMNAPRRVDGFTSFEFVAEEGGDAWLQLALDVGQILYAETRGPMGEGAVDTMLNVTDLSGAALDSDDDDGQGQYSLLAYEPGVAAEYVLNLTGYQATLGPGTRLTLDVGVFDRDDVVLLGSEPEGAPTAPIGAPRLAMTPDGYGYLRIVPERTALVSFLTDMRHLLPADGGRVMQYRRTSDAAGSVLYLLEEGREYLAQYRPTESGYSLFRAIELARPPGEGGVDPARFADAGIVPLDPVDGFEIGDRVRLGRHAEVQGETNWAEEMDKYVGCIATITRATEPEGIGLENVVVSLNYDEVGSEWNWRTLNLTQVGPGEQQAERCRAYE
jgi:hypothetical protein